MTFLVAQLPFGQDVAHVDFSSGVCLCGETERQVAAPCEGVESATFDPWLLARSCIAFGNL